MILNNRSKTWKSEGLFFHVLGCNITKDSEINPIHVVWGIPKGARSPAVLVTAYRPDPAKWSSDFIRRMS
jgi:hypothetical protein